MAKTKEGGAEKKEAATEKSRTAGEAVAILPCSCKHEFQDQRYGRGMRVANPSRKSPPMWRCTVCGKELRK